MMADPNYSHDDDRDFADEPRDIEGALGEEAAGRDVPIEDEAPDVEAPRRAASAQFVVDQEIGSEAALREAMDPANRSLAEALRLSYRILQAFILVLIVLFIVSGVQTVEEDQSGVRLVLGKIAADDGTEALDPGLQWSPLPFPAGEFIILDVENRPIDLSRDFWPEIPAGRTEESAIEAATTGSGLRPGRDGFLVLNNADLGHVKLAARYDIVDPGRFVRLVHPSGGDELVSRALRRAMVHVAAELQLAQLVEMTPEVRSSVQAEAQRLLDELECGIQITSVSIPSASPAFAIAKVQTELQSARVQAEQTVAQARSDATATLLSAAGQHYATLLDLIEQYEAAFDQDDSAAADAILAQINGEMMHANVSGAVSEIVERARSYRSQVELTLGSEARRFASLQQAFQENPRLVVNRMWLDQYQKVMAQPDIEVYYVPHGLEHMALRIPGLEDVARMRQRLSIEEKNREATLRGVEAIRGWRPRAEDINVGRANTRLRVDEHGNVVSNTQP